MGALTVLFQAYISFYKVGEWRYSFLIQQVCSLCIHRSLIPALLPYSVGKLYVKAGRTPVWYMSVFMNEEPWFIA